MEPLKKFMALAVILIGIFSFSKKEDISSKTALNLENINVVDILSNQEFECRPSSEFIFFVETSLVKKIRGANQINAKVYILDKLTGSKSLLAQDNVQINKFEGSIEIKDYNTDNNLISKVLENGDKIIGGSENSPYSFNDLLEYESIYNSYINSTNKLLKLNRSI